MAWPPELCARVQPAQEVPTDERSAYDVVWLISRPRWLHCWACPCLDQKRHGPCHRQAVHRLRS
eukprot:2301451-Prymnesium_polylepis.1